MIEAKKRISSAKLNNNFEDLKKNSQDYHHEYKNSSY